MTTPLALLLARARADRWLLALVVVALATTALLAGAAPRLLDALARASLDGEIEDARTDQIGLAATSIQRSDSVTRSALTASATGATAEIEPELAVVLGEPAVVVDTVRHVLGPLPDGPPVTNDLRLTLRSQSGIEDDVRLVVGAWPADGPVDTVEVGPGPTGLLPVHQFVATAATAEALGLLIGDRRVALPDPEGPVVRRLPLGPPPAVAVELSGIVELTDRARPVWFEDTRLHQPALRDTPQGVTVFGFGLVPQDALGGLPTGGTRGAVQLTYRWQLDREALVSGDAPAVQQAAGSMRSRIPRTPEELRWATGLDRLLAAEADRRATAVEVLGLGAAAVLGVGVALLLTLAGLLAARRRDALGLVRGRGASRAQVLLADVVEALLLALPAVVVAVAGLGVLLPGDRSPLVPVGVVVVGASLLVLAGRPDARRPLGALLSRRGRGGGSHPGRVVLEGLVVVVATVAVVGLRQRGVLPDGDVDPLVVAAPVLATVAAALLVARLLPLPLALLDLVVRRRAGLGASVGVARAARDPRVRAAVPLVVVGIAVVGFGLAIDGTVGAGQSDAADVAVGADVRIAAQALASLDQDWVPPDPDAVVVELALVDGDLVTSTGSDELRVVAVDVSALGALATDLPPLATGVGPAPLVVSNVVRLAGSPGVGTTLNVLVGLTRVPATIVELRPRALGLDLTDGQFVLIDREAVVRATGEVPATTTRLVVTDRPELVAASARAADPSADVVQRADVAADLAAAPLASGVRIGFRTAAGAAGAATAVALLLQLAAGGRVRRREAAVLGAVGTPPAEVRRAALAEVLPVVLGAALAGAGLARAATVLLADRLDLSSFTGQTAGTAAIMAPSAPALVGLVVAAGLVAATGVVATLGRIDMTGVLREEG